MRKLWIATMLVSAVTAFSTAQAGGPVQSQSYAGDECDECDDCCHHRGLLFGLHHHGHHGNGCLGGGYEGLGYGFNCGCNGSYKFPVPPLYTYHWPGMWSAQLMTDYHSPWRFPPLKPYVDEVAPQTMGADDSVLTRIRPVSVTRPAPRQEQTSFSRHLELMSR